MTILPHDPRARLRQWLEAEHREGLFSTLSGAHAYGFASADSDFDVRGVFVAPLQEALGIQRPDEARHLTLDVDGIGEIDYVAWEVRKFCEMLLKKNGNAFEALYAPLLIACRDAEVLERARSIGRRVLTRHIYYHYGGFYRNQRAEVDKAIAAGGRVAVKRLLYCYRVLLSGFSAVERGEINPNLPDLAHAYEVSRAADLIERKRQGREKETSLSSADAATYLHDLDALERRLQQMYTDSRVRDKPDPEAVVELDLWQVDVRLTFSR